MVVQSAALLEIPTVEYSQVPGPVVPVMAIPSVSPLAVVGEMSEETNVPEFVELSTVHARKQFEVMTAQTKELAALAQKMTTDVTEPLKAEVTKAFGNSIA